MLFEEVLNAALYGSPTPGLDSGELVTALRSATRHEIQPAADIAARVSNKAEWELAVVPPVQLATGAQWLEWRLPEDAHARCGGSPLGVLIETDAAAARLLCFMHHTPMLRFEIRRAADGLACADRLVDVVHVGRAFLPVSASLDGRRDDIYNATFAWVFIAPVLLSLAAQSLGGLESVESAVRVGRSLPEVLVAPRTRRVSATKHLCVVGDHQ